MRRFITTIGIAAVLIAAAATGRSIHARQNQSQPQPTQQQQQQLQLEQQRQQAAQQAAEARRRQEEADREKILRDLTTGPVDLAKTVPRQVTEPCLGQAMRPNFAFDIREIPLEQWLLNKEIVQIPWKVRIGQPQMRFDQRYELAYSGRIRGKDLGWSGGRQELKYVSGISSPDGTWVIPPKSGVQIFDLARSTDFEVQFSDCVFLRPVSTFYGWSSTIAKRHDTTSPNEVSASRNSQTIRSRN